MTLPPGLVGKVAGVPECSEAQANAGTCGAESLIGETIVVVGVGNDPYTVTGGKVYLTGGCRHLNWPHCGRLKWPHLCPTYG